MKVLIAGSRGIKNIDIGKYVPTDTELIISGGADGIDSLAEKYADTHRISKLIIRPRYDLYGRAAAIRRNETMVDISDLVIVIWDGVSRGTKYTLDYAEKKGKNTVVILCDGDGNNKISEI